MGNNFSTADYDKVLLHKNSDEHIIANTYLHIIGTFPEFIADYNLSKKEKFWLPIRFRLIFLFRLFQSIFNGKYSHSHHESVKSDVLFVSHLTNMQQLLKNDDAYFGDLSEQLLVHGVNSSIALIRHTRVSKMQVLRGWKNSEIPRFLLSSNLNFLSEVRLYFAQKKSKKMLKSILRDLQLDKELSKDILHHHLSSGTIGSLRVAKQVVEIARKIGAKSIITSYEGHAWERLVFYYAKKANLDVKCFGYQYANVSKYHYAVKRSLKKEYNPDVILTSGVISKNAFKQGQLRDEKIFCIGSPRHTEIGTMKDKVRCCLVVPSGYVEECLTLFDLSLIYAKQHKNQKFIWRMKSPIDIKMLKKYNPDLEKIPDNISISRGSLDNDIKECDSVLYRSSTATISAINSGLKPIYCFQPSDKLSIDPICGQQGRVIVHNQEELDLALGQSIDAKTMQSLQDFSQDFYTPLDVSVLLKLL